VHFEQVLGELKFLAELDRRGQADINIVEEEMVTLSGMSKREFFEMVIHFMVDGYVNGPATLLHNKAVYGSSVDHAVKMALIRKITSTQFLPETWDQNILPSGTLEG
jgi:hypothetical protein